MKPKELQIQGIAVSYSNNCSYLSIFNDTEFVGVIKAPLPQRTIGQDNQSVYNWKQKTFNGELTLKLSDIELSTAAINSKFSSLLRDVANSVKTVAAAKEPEKSNTEITPSGSFTATPEPKIEEQPKTTANPAKVIDDTGYKYEDAFKDYPSTTLDKLPELTASPKISPKPDLDKCFFIGSFIKKQKEGDKGEYVILSTPHPEKESQKAVIFNKDTTALFVYSALLTHPGFKPIISEMATFPVSSIDPKDLNKINCIYVADGLKFIKRL